jgi:hypothetical protein
VLAHRALDEGNLLAGYRAVRISIGDDAASVSRILHLQWHLLVFEIELGLWHSARYRYGRYLEPAASGHDGPIDIPSALWRLELTRPGSTGLDWSGARVAALRFIEKPIDDYVILHNLLAFAGAGDIGSIASYLRSGHRSSHASLLALFARSLRAYALGDFERAYAGLSEVAPCAGELGGSRAQNELFASIQDAAADRLQKWPRG